MQSRGWSLSAIRKLAQHSVIAMFLCLHSMGCFGLFDGGTPTDERPTASSDLPVWERFETAGLALAASHSGEVLALHEVAQKPGQAVSVGADGSIIAWSLHSGSGHTLQKLKGPIQLATLGRRHGLVAWSSGFTIHVMCVAPLCSHHWELTRLKTRATSLAFHEDDSALLIGGADSRVYRWRFLAETDAKSFKEWDKLLERYIAHQTLISNVLSLHTGRAFFSSDWDGALFAWLAYTADDQQGSYDRNLFGGRFFGNLGSYMQAPRLADRGITSMAISENGERIAVGSDQGFVEVWAVRGMEMIARYQAHSGRVISVSLNDSGSRVASVGRDSKISVSELSADPSFGIAVGVYRYRTSSVFADQMKTARQCHFISSGDLLITTSEGQLGEISLTNVKAAPLPTPAPQKTAPIASTDSDY